jgi:subtilase family serine protease
MVTRAPKSTGRILALVYLSFLLGVGVTAAAPRPAQAGQKLAGQVPSAAAHLVLVKALDEATLIDLIIGLRLRNSDSLNRLIHDLYNPEAREYSQYLSPEQYATNFCPTAANYEKLLNFAKANGLRVVMEANNRKFLHIKAPAGVINRVFHTTLQQYRHPTEDRLFYAPDRQPWIAFKPEISYVTGLDDFHLPGRFLNRASERPKGEPRSAGGSGSGGEYTGKDFRAAYVPNTWLTGKGQVLGILELSGGYAQSDISEYESQRGLPSVPVQNVFVDSFAGGSPIKESTADIELAISMAPGLSRLLVYGAPYGQAGVHDILFAMANPSPGEPLPRQISTSYYFFYDSNVYDSLKQLAAQGQAFFVASGDYGSYDEITGGGDYPPADYPMITSVGGTELETSGPEGNWTAETTWNWVGTVYKSGGGYSPWAADPQFGLPSYQQGIDLTAARGSPSARNAPDVAMVADNISIYFNGTWSFFAGTSAAAPLWAGFMALVNERAETVGRPPLGFANPALYRAGNLNSTNFAFHDITTGNNFNSTNPALYSAVPGFDLCTGWGSPNGGNLINALVIPTFCQLHPAECHGVFDPWWWLKCPACGLDIFINLGDDFRGALVYDALGRPQGRFERLTTPFIENGVTFNYKVSVKPLKGMGYIFKAESRPGESKAQFDPVYVVRRTTTTLPAARKTN